VSKPQSLKEELAWLRLLFVSFFAVAVSVIAWIAHNYGSAPIVLIILAALVAIFMGMLILGVWRRLYECLAELKEE
jgi:Flp pilus assembly protein TadB